MERWKKVKGYEGIYEVSNEGNVRNVVTGKTLRLRDNGNGYYRVGLWKNKTGRKHYVHRIVAEAFISNPFSKAEVNHIDSNRKNNKVSNLEWVSSSGNTIHAIKKGRLSPWGNRPKKIIATNLTTGERTAFNTITEAEKHIGTRHITDVLKGKRQKAKGFTFVYAEGGDAE